MAHEKKDEIIWPAYVDMLTVLVMIFIMFSIVFILRLSMYNIAQKMTANMQQKPSTQIQHQQLPPPIIYMQQDANLTKWDLILPLDNSLSFAKSQQQMVDKWLKEHPQSSNARYQISIELSNRTHASLGAMLRKIYILYAKTANYMHHKHNISTNQIQFLNQSNQTSGQSNLIKIKVEK
ncbi:hypothetical protein [Cysteiniphilum halobium]|uniref:hypothetical protein n=1 Tax=Cysteiniphilum halobium TaxID=2219059 RepID=UPI000E655547|nr:hypothetical protein [Cysteiniphilum halobium]